jgi:hypothetical protein
LSLDQEEDAPDEEEDANLDPKEAKTLEAEQSSEAPVPGNGAGVPAPKQPVLTLLFGRLF